jgi:hypothetical protein
MAEIGVLVIDRVVKEEMRGTVNMKEDIWIIPQPKRQH